MDVPIKMTETQLILVWVLLGILLVWLSACLFLAFRPNSKKSALSDDHTSTTSFPQVAPQLHTVVRASNVAVSPAASSAHIPSSAEAQPVTYTTDIPGEPTRIAR